MNHVLLKSIVAIYSQTRLQSQTHSASAVLLTAVIAKQRNTRAAASRVVILLLVT